MRTHLDTKTTKSVLCLDCTFCTTGPSPSNSETTLDLSLQYFHCLYIVECHYLHSDLGDLQPMNIRTFHKQIKPLQLQDLTVFTEHNCLLFFVIYGPQMHHNKPVAHPCPAFLVVLCTSLCDAVTGIHMSSLKSEDLPCPDCLHCTHPVKTQDDFLCLIISPHLLCFCSTDLCHDASDVKSWNITTYSKFSTP